MFVRYLVAIITLPIYLLIFMIVGLIGGIIGGFQLTVEAFEEIVYPSRKGDDYAPSSKI